MKLWLPAAVEEVFFRLGSFFLHYVVFMWCLMHFKKYIKNIKRTDQVYMVIVEDNGLKLTF